MGKQIKRHIIRCKVCHRVVRRSRPSEYCSTACKQAAWRQRHKAKLDAPELDFASHKDALRYAINTYTDDKHVFMLQNLDGTEEALTLDMVDAMPDDEVDELLHYIYLWLEKEQHKAPVVGPKAFLLELLNHPGVTAWLDDLQLDQAMIEDMTDEEVQKSDIMIHGLALKETSPA